MGVSGQCKDLAVLYPSGKDTMHQLDRRLGGPQTLEEKSFASTGDRNLVVQSVVRHYTDWVTPPPLGS
jgi:hypothetical protein